MRRIDVKARANWHERLHAHGFEFHTIDGQPYWIEDACYEFSAREIDVLDDACNELHAMCLQAVADIVGRGDYEPFALSIAEASLVERSWQLREPALYGRMDLCFDGRQAPKLLEYNADTPTSLLEASVAQWFWLEDRGESGFDQFNSLHEKLIATWPQVLGDTRSPVHFACHQDSAEDFGTTEYLRDTCIQAGYSTRCLDMSEIGFDGSRFIDLDNREIQRMFKLYPWEWLFAEEFGTYLLSTRTRWIEPAWKRLLADKAILGWLWQRHLGHPNLLPASFDRTDLTGECVFKPCLEREGRGVHFLTAGRPADAETVRGIYQQSQRLPSFQGWHALIGAWVVGDQSAGIGIREDIDAITRNTSRFVPHRFR